MEGMQPPPPLPGDRPGARRPRRLGALGVLVLVICLVVLAGIVWTAWLLLAPKLTHGGGGGAKSAGPLEIRPVTSTKPGACPSGGPGVTGDDSGTTACFRLGAGMTVTKVAEARAQQGTGGWQIEVGLNPQDATRFAALTRKYQHHRLALVTGGKVLSAPTVFEPIVGGRVQIAGNFTGDEAKEIARSLGG
jgi:preprotein translocase subunit SecD